MNDRVFIDTNILLYARDVGQPAKQLIAHAWMTSLWRTRQGRLSFQVLQEFYVNATQKLKPGLPVLLARQDIRSLLAWRPVKNDSALIESAWMLADRYGFSWWDAQIVAAARRADCRILLTEDMQHRMEVDGMLLLNPFASDVPQPDQT